MSLPASRFPVDGGLIDRLDKRLSAPLFRLQLGLAGEALLSLPGCFFGMPGFHVISPTLVACAVDGCRDASGPALAAVVRWSSGAFVPATVVRWSSGPPDNGGSVVLWCSTPAAVRWYSGHRW